MNPPDRRRPHALRAGPCASRKYPFPQQSPCPLSRFELSPTGGLATRSAKARRTGFARATACAAPVPVLSSASPSYSQGGMMMCSGACRTRPGTWLAAAALLLVALGGCKTGDLYRSGYDKRLTQETWANRSPNDAVVIIGGYRSVWQNAADPSYQFEARQRFRIDWTHTFDAALVKAGHLPAADAGAPRRQLRRVRRIPGAGRPGRRGDRELPGRHRGRWSTWATWTRWSWSRASGPARPTCRWDNSYAGVLAAFAKQVPYVTAQPTINLMTINQSLVRFPCGQGG